MIIKILMENTAQDSGLIAEHGLSLYIQTNTRRILFDAGQSSAFADNAARMGVDLSKIDLCVLSHGHYDHSDGLPAFFRENSRARVYMRGSARKRYYGVKEGKPRYIGVNREIFRRHGDRICFVQGRQELLPGVWLLPHSTAGLESIAARSDLYVRRGLRLRPDDFSHEQSLVLDTEQGLVIFNSCSHAGADNIISEVAAAFPGRQIHSLIGGLHLYKLSDGEVRAFAGRVRQSGIARLYTGHCTGERAFAVLKEELGDAAAQLHTGLVIAL